MNVDFSEVYRLEADIHEEGIRAAMRASEVLVDHVEAVVATATSSAVVGPTGEWQAGFRAFAGGTERPPTLGDLDVEATNLDWAAHIIEFGALGRPGHRTLGNAADRHEHDLMRRMGKAAGDAFS